MVQEITPVSIFPRISWSVKNARIAFDLVWILAAHSRKTQVSENLVTQQRSDALLGAKTTAPDPMVAQRSDSKESSASQARMDFNPTQSTTICGKSLHVSGIIMSH